MTVQSSDTTLSDGARAGVSARRHGANVSFLRTLRVVWQREVLIYVRDRMRLASMLFMPIIMLVIFGEGLGNTIGNLAPGVDYREFIFPGILAQSVLMASMFAGTSVVMDREFGFLREMLVSPASRAALCLGKILGGASIAMSQGLVLFVLAPIIGVDIGFTAALAMFGALAVMAIVLTAGGVALGTRMRSVESMQMVAQLIIFPSMFLSGVFFPINNVPTWMEILVKVNPVTYAVAPIRAAGLSDRLDNAAANATVHVELFGRTLTSLEELAIVVFFGVILLALAVRGLQRS